MSLSTVASLSDDDLTDALARSGGVKGHAAGYLGITEQSLRRALKARGIGADDPSLARRPPVEKSFGERPSMKIVGDECFLVTEATPEDLGEIDDLLRSYGLDPEDWIVTNVTLNRWEGMTSDKATGDNRIMPLRQIKVALRRKVTVALLSPATHIPALPHTGRVVKGEARRILIESDHHVPFQDIRLHEARLKLVELVQPDEDIILGDVLDFSTISRHNDHPSTSHASPQECIDQGYRLLRDIREASPLTKIRKLEGNHDARLDKEQLARAERIFGLCPAEETVPALHLSRLLHLAELGIEFVESPLGWEHAEIELVPGQAGLIGRHGWMTGHNTAERSMKRRGRSLIVGHGHKRELAFWWDPSLEIERVAAMVGCMCLVRSDRHPHYTVCDTWLQGCAMVTAWPDGDFIIEHIPWDGRNLRWRKERFTG